MTERERFRKALRREKITGRVPHFELVFFLTMEAIGKVHPSHRSYHQWNQMSQREKSLQMNDMADCYVEIARMYHHSAIFIHPNPGDLESTMLLLSILREKTGDAYYIMMHGDPTHSIPDGEHMMDFAVKMHEDPESLRKQSERHVREFSAFAEALDKRGHLLDGFALCSDYCFNTNPFFTPDMFDLLIAPYLTQITRAYHDLGFDVIKHTDGNIMPILDQLVACGPDALHSLDPQGGVDLAKVKREYGDRVTLIGNVNCGLLQTGTEEECIADVRRALRDGMQGGPGYIFSTSNCAYTGLPLSRYELMHKIWWEEGIWPQ